MKLFSKDDYLKNKIVLITGGSKGLGVTLAEHLIKENCRIALCARSDDELEKARRHLENLGGKVFVKRCDVGKEAEVKELIHSIIQHYGGLDVVINVAGIIQVGPMETFTHEDYEKAMDVMYWGIVNTTLNVVPYMKQRKRGHIVNVTSIGGKVSVPHLLPYNAAKFAAVGFSEGSAAELKKDNIHVTTIVPGLMRTGSYVNAQFQKGNKKEFKLFSFFSTVPGLTLSADRAAAKIIEAIKDKKTFKVIGLQYGLLMRLHGLFPALTPKIFSTVSEALPGKREETPLEKGKEMESREGNIEVPGTREIGKQAREDHQELRH